MSGSANIKLTGSAQLKQHSCFRLAKVEAMKLETVTVDRKAGLFVKIFPLKLHQLYEMMKITLAVPVTGP